MIIFSKFKQCLVSWLGRPMKSAACCSLNNDAHSHIVGVHLFPHIWGRGSFCQIDPLHFINSWLLSCRCSGAPVTHPNTEGRHMINTLLQTLTGCLINLLSLTKCIYTRWFNHSRYTKKIWHPQKILKNPNWPMTAGNALYFYYKSKVCIISLTLMLVVFAV